ncbi:hypothetical protein H0H87_011198, partial [Tephrocybe sp. NHM501043]
LAHPTTFNRSDLQFGRTEEGRLSLNVQYRRKTVKVLRAIAPFHGSLSSLVLKKAYLKDFLCLPPFSFPALQSLKIDVQYRRHLEDDETTAHVFDGLEQLKKLTLERMLYTPKLFLKDIPWQQLTHLVMGKTVDISVLLLLPLAVNLVEAFVGVDVHSPKISAVPIRQELEGSAEKTFPKLSELGICATCPGVEKPMLEFYVRTRLPLEAVTLSKFFLPLQPRLDLLHTIVITPIFTDVRGFVELLASCPLLSTLAFIWVNDPPDFPNSSLLDELKNLEDRTVAGSPLQLAIR